MSGPDLASEAESQAGSGSCRGCRGGDWALPTTRRRTSPDDPSRSGEAGMPRQNGRGRTDGPHPAWPLWGSSGSYPQAI